MAWINESYQSGQFLGFWERGFQLKETLSQNWLIAVFLKLEV